MLGEAFHAHDEADFITAPRAYSEQEIFHYAR
jgi:hypothetical protein